MFKFFRFFKTRYYVELHSKNKYYVRKKNLIFKYVLFDKTNNNIKLFNSELAAIYFLYEYHNSINDILDIYGFYFKKFKINSSIDFTLKIVKIYSRIFKNVWIRK